MSDVFSTEERAAIKRYLSYPDWSNLAASIQLGVPAASQPLFLVERQFDLISPEARDNVRKDMAELDSIECQLREARGRMKATRVGEVELNMEETNMLRRELMWWTTRLADDLAVVPNPYSQMIYRAINSVGGINGTWTV